MRHRATRRFWDAYRQLPDEIQALADRGYELLCRNPRHPSLHLKRVGLLWSVRVGIHYRALASEVDGDLVWVWIGHHTEYDRLCRGGPRP
jgi:hypothetical protein